MRRPRKPVPPNTVTVRPFVATMTQIASLCRSFSLLAVEETIRAIEQIFAILDSTYQIIAEDSAAQKPLMRVLMTLFDEGKLNPVPWWMMAQEKDWMKQAIAEATRLGLLKPDFPSAAIADMLMRIYLANLRDYLFDKTSLDAFRDSATFEFWFCLSNIAADGARADYAARASRAAASLTRGAA